jgi:PAS domain S-box-containing protein
MRAALPENEAARLAALEACAILDSEAEDAFTELAVAAAHGCGVGISLISLVDRDRQWFKASLGLSAKETPRDVAFCAHAILGKELFEIPDARLDPRFCDNPLVTGEPGVRFYAGAPIELDDGNRVGTLCVIDREARSLSDEQRYVLRTLAKQVALRLDLRRVQGERDREIAAQARARREIEALADELRGEEARFRTLTEAIPQLVWTATPDGAGDYYNRRWIEYTGLNGEPGDMTDFRRVYHPDDLERCLRKWAEAIESGSTYEQEYRLRRASDGAYRWHLGRALPLRGDDGRIVKWFGTCTDIDDQRRAKEALLAEQRRLDARVREGTAQLQASNAAQQHSENRFRALIDRVPIGIFEADLEGNYLFVNAGWEQLAGMTNEEAKGMGWRRGIHADERERVAAAWQAAVRGRQDFATEYRRHTPRGVSWMLVTASPLRDPAGKVTGYLGAVTDVTERRRVEAMTQRLASVVESSNDAIFSLTLDGVITDWNLGAERIFGYTAREMIGGSFFILVPCDRVDEHFEVLERLQRGETVDHVETVHVRKDRALIDISASVSAVRDASGAIVGLSRIARDVTAARRVAAELSRAKAAAEAATRAKSDFLANMSHEIRTPMTAVLGFTELLLESELTESDRLNYLMTVRRNGEHLLSVLNDILDFSKIEAGKLSTERISCSVCQILGEVESLMRVRANEKDLAFEIVYASPIPAAIASDPTRLRQIVLNLVSNAIKFTERGSVSVEARCEAVDSGSPELVLDVVDTGIGLTREQIACLFQPFSQADPSTTRRYGGSGLGLGICAPLAVALGGTIAVTSEPGRGSTFTLRLAIEAAAVASMMHATDAVALTGRMSGQSERVGPPRLEGRVLLAEDGHDNQVLISRLLQTWGLEVSLAENGLTAVAQATAATSAGRPFDLILMDMQMPEMDGYGATAHLRAEGYRGKIVALTAHAMTGERERCLRAGCDDYLRKPIERAAAWAMVAACVSRQPISSRAAAAVSAPPAAIAEAAPRSALYSVYADDPDLAGIVVDFVARLPDRLGAMQAAVEGLDLGRLQSLAHQLRGSAGSYGFLPITVAAARVEDALTSGEQVSRVASEVASLIALCARARPGLAPARGASIAAAPPR